MAALNDQHKVLIVQALACFDTPTQVAALVKEEFGLVVTRQQVATYDPTKAAGKQISPKLRAIFEETRAKFLADTATIPIAQQAYRLRNLQRLFERAVERNNPVLAAQHLEQAAREAGGAFTNKRELTGKDGAPLAPGPTTIELVAPST